MTTDVDGNYRGAYTYANGERISVEDLGQVEGTPNDPLYYLNDAQGTTAVITNMNAGIIDNNRFAPYGEPLSPVAKNSRLTNSPWGYAGESDDIEAGLVYLRARYYEPGTGRFIQQDNYPYFGEIEEPLTRNLYIYGNGNPLKYTDPSGNYTKEEGTIAHRELQKFFMAIYGSGICGMRGYVEYAINTNVSINSSGRGIADIVLYSYSTDIYEIYEIKPYSQRKRGRSQLNSYVQALKKNKKLAKRGTTFNPNGLVLPYPLYPNKVIKYYTYPNDHGMIYYNIVNKKKEPQAATVKEKEKTNESQKILEDGLEVAGAAAGVYITYRAIRMIPSLFPPLWWTIPANAVTP